MESVGLGQPKIIYRPYSSKCIITENSKTLICYLSLLKGLAIYNRIGGKDDSYIQRGNSISWFAAIDNRGLSNYKVFVNGRSIFSGD